MKNWSWHTRLVVFAAVALFLVFTPATIEAQDPLGGMAIGAGLTVLANNINSAMERAIGGGMILEIQAGGQISLAIQQAQHAFSGEQDKFFSDLNSNEQSAINSVAAVANDFLNKASADFGDLMNRAQAAAHDLPFSKNFPQVWKFTPTYFEKSAGRTLEIQLTGDFYDLGLGGLDAILTLGAKTYKNVHKNSSAVSFEIPMNDLNNAQDRPVKNMFSVAVPYKEGIFGKREEAVFKASVAALPEKLADLDVAITTSNNSTKQQIKFSAEQLQESNDDDIKCGGEHADLAIHKMYPDTGWRVVPNSVKWSVTWSQGKEGLDQDWWLASDCSTPLLACLCVSTEHHARGTSGKVHFRIVFTEETDVVNTSTNHTKIEIGWGESRVVTVPVGATWTGTYRKFDGKVIQFAGPYHDAFVSVSQAANAVTIATAPF